MTRNGLLDSELFALHKSSPLGVIARLRDCTTRRVSSWDRQCRGHAGGDRRPELRS